MKSDEESGREIEMRPFEWRTRGRLENTRLTRRGRRVGGGAGDASQGLILVSRSG